MLPPESLPTPPEWRDLLEELGHVFARRSTHRLFMALACGLILADRGTVTGMAAAAGIGREWRRACWFFAAAKWDPDALGLAVARLVVKYLLSEGAPVTVACDGTLFKRWGRHVFEARWAYDGSAQGGKKIAFGNTWVVAAVVVRLPCCPSPVALPVLFRLWRGKGTGSQVELAAGMLKVLAGAFPGRQVHGTGDAAFHGEPLVIEGTTWTTRLPANAVLSGPKPPPTGRRGRPREKGDRIGTCAGAAQAADWRDTVICAYGKTGHVQVAAQEALWHGSFRSAPGRLVLIREPDSAKPYDLGLFTLDTVSSPAQIAERYSWRWAIEPSNATGKQLTGAGDACNRTQRAVERTVPFAFLVQSLMIVWYALSCDPADAIAGRRSRCPWYRTKATPSPADMHAALRSDLISARINGNGPGHRDPAQITTGTLTSEAQAA
ncbi:MAG: IS701 family transposase [Streptosporangiaceae bacterium]